MTADAPAPQPQTLKVLMVHGYTQSGPIFRTKTRALEKLLVKTLAPLGISLTLIYPTAPLRLTSTQIPGMTPPSSPGRSSPSRSPGHSRSSSTSSVASHATSSDDDDEDENLIESFGWYRHQVAGGYFGLRKGMMHLANTIREAGGVDAIVGFSQGAAVATIVAAALEPDRILSPSDLEQCDWAPALRAANNNRPLRFGILYSGFRCRVQSLEWAYDGPLRTPIMSVLGTLDTVVDEDRTVALADVCTAKGSTIVRHPGGHHVPTARQWAMPVAAFIRDHRYGVWE